MLEKFFATIRFQRDFPLIFGETEARGHQKSLLGLAPIGHSRARAGSRRPWYRVNVVKAPRLTYLIMFPLKLLHRDRDWATEQFDTENRWSVQWLF